MINANRKLDVSIGLSARCQRNYDENKSISEEDLRTLKKCIQHAPSKQNKRLFDAIIVKDKEKRKSYAASFGFTKFPKALKDKFKNYLKSFNTINVREHSSIALVKSLNNINASHTVDPTFLMTKKDLCPMVNTT